MQRAQERLDSKERRKDAQVSFDTAGNPTKAYAEFDGYSDYKTKSPMQSTTRHSKGDTKRLGNRVMGVIVTCGPVDTRFVYSMNDLINSGSNIMIECVRQGKYSC